MIGILYQITAVDIGKNTLYGNIETLDPSKISKLNADTVTSDDYIRNLQNGTYMVNGASAYLPFGYGTITVIHTGNAYGYALGVATETGAIYTRHFYGTGWHSDWVKVADGATIENISFTMCSKFDRASTATRLIRCGKVASLMLNCKTIQAISLGSTYEEILTFDTKYSPKNGMDVFGLCYIYNSDNVIVLDIYNGKASTRALTSTPVSIGANTMIRGYITWIIGE